MTTTRTEPALCRSSLLSILGLAAALLGAAACGIEPADEPGGPPAADAGSDGPGLGPRRRAVCNGTLTIETTQALAGQTAPFDAACPLTTSKK